MEDKKQTITTIQIGYTPAGKPFYVDLAQLKHLLIGCPNELIKDRFLQKITDSILARNQNDLIQLEIISYDPEKGLSQLKVLNKTMDEHINTLRDCDCRNILQYNETSNAKMPYIVIVVEELYHLMKYDTEQTEKLLNRILVYGGFSGIILICASRFIGVDIFTGIIKANMPNRLAFRTKDTIGSRTVLDIKGAEVLAENEMLYFPLSADAPIKLIHK